MTDLDLTVTQGTLALIAEMSLSPELTRLDEFIARVEQSAPVVESQDLRELALAVAQVQRVAHRQLERA